MLIICTFCIYKFTYFQTFIWHSNINTCGTSVVICKCLLSSEKVESPHMHIPNWGQIRWHSAFIFGSPAANKCSLFSAIFFSFFCAFYWWFHCLKWPLSIWEELMDIYSSNKTGTLSVLHSDGRRQTINNNWET